MNSETKSANKKVILGMSGGVDSSVAGALLAQAGYQVQGVFLKLWMAESSANERALAQNQARAQFTADQLGIPLTVIDAGDPFRRRVIQYFIDEMEHGRTPNPCVMCNPEIKWQFLLKTLQEMNADLLATGHYARVSTTEIGEVELRKAVDAQKDQSYFLSRLSQQELRRSIFPLGGYSKEDVRAMAQQTGLVTAEAPDSQDLCFLGDVSLQDFLESHLNAGLEPGDIVDASGLRLGTHEGLANYTIGQRKGIKIAAEKPYYVLSKDAVTNTLRVGGLENLGLKELRASDCRWINAAPDAGKEYDFKIRYKSLYNRGVITSIHGDKIAVAFRSPLRDITPGQLVVCYEGDRVVGSGFIDG